MSPCTVVITIDSLSLPNSGPDEAQVARAKVLTEDLLEVVRIEHGKAQAALAQQQMELHHAQIQFAQYSAMTVSTRSLRQIHADTNVDLFLSIGRLRRSTSTA